MSAEEDREAFIEAITGGEPDDRVSWRLGWLSALLSDLITSDWPASQPDPLACWEAIRECQTLARRLREACEGAVGPARVELLAADGNDDEIPY